MSSKRRKDLDDESVLQPFLDAVYRELGFDFRRETKRDKQLAGIDLVLSHRGQKVYSRISFFTIHNPTNRVAIASLIQVWA